MEETDKKPIETLHASKELEHENETPSLDEGLDEQDLTDADSFPASDPPAMP